MTTVRDLITCKVLSNAIPVRVGPLVFLSRIRPPPPLHSRCLPAFAAGPNEAGCAINYKGVRCSECRAGSYLRNGRCKFCPNTAWLLFLMFAIAIVSAVAAAVYLSKKRVNLAGLSVGVVRHG